MSLVESSLQLLGKAPQIVTVIAVVPWHAWVQRYRKVMVWLHAVHPSVFWAAVRNFGAGHRGGHWQVSYGFVQLGQPRPTNGPPDPAMASHRRLFSPPLRGANGQFLK